MGLFRKSNVSSEREDATDILNRKLTMDKEAERAKETGPGSVPVDELKVAGPSTRQPWYRRRSAWELFLQFFAVLMGVSLATMVSSCREKRDAALWNEQSLLGISNEVAANLGMIAERRDYYGRVAEEALGMIEAKGEAATLREVTSFRGLNPVMLRSSAFQVRLQSPPGSIVDYELEERIANLYGRQDWVLAGMDKWMDYIILHTDLYSMSVQDIGVIMKEWENMCTELEAAYRAIQEYLPEPVP